jgi:aminopeptidase N
MKKLLLSGILILFLPPLFAQDKTVTYYQDGAANPPDLVISLKHIKAEISFNPAENLVIGTAEFIFTPRRYKTDSIVFYTPDFTVKAVSIQQSDVPFKTSGNSLIIYPPSSILKRGEKSTLRIVYDARPQRGAIYFIGWRPEEAGKRRQIWAHRPHGWLPYMDARITMDLYVNFDKKYKVFSNGERIEVKENNDNTLTWHYKMARNHPFFSTSLVIGDYDFKTSKSAGGVPLEFWYYRGQEEKVQPTYQYTEAMMDFLGKETGVPYPYPVYRQAPVIDYMYGAMECTTATVFGDFILIDPHAFWQRNYINTNAHEMAHQWYGDAIAHLENKDVWLTESFGTYFAKMFERSVFGEEYYQNVMNEELNQALAASKINNYPVNSSMGGVARIYQKGSLVLGMLRYVMGEKEFHDAIKLYTERYLFNYSETSDFIRCVYDVTGKPYNWFFEEWVLHGGEPSYKVSCSVQDDTTGNRSTHIQVWQIHETNDLIGLFKMPVKFMVCYKDGTSESVVNWVEHKYDEVIIPNPQKKPIDFILFDPGHEVMKKVIFDRSFEELSAQALKAENMIDRYDALLAVRLSPLDQKKELLMKCYAKESFHLTKTEIIGQLAGDTNSATLAIFREALNDPDANVRKAVLVNLTPIPLALKPDFEKALDDFSYLNVELALQDLCQSFPTETDHYLEMTKSMEGWRGKNIRMKWLEISIAAGKNDHIVELVDYSGPKYEFETRMNSLNTLKKLRYVDETTIKNARSASQHWNNKLSTVGKDYLTYFGVN